MKDVLSRFDTFLVKKGLTFEGIVIGADALIILDIIDRRTKHVDFLDPKIGIEVKTATVEFSKMNPDLNLLSLQSLAREGLGYENFEL